MVAETAISRVTIEKHGAKVRGRGFGARVAHPIGSLVPTKANQS